MGRLWQTLILMQQYPVFEFLPVESLIKENQEEYYKVLEYIWINPGILHHLLSLY